jgi:hypothetical protein
MIAHKYPQGSNDSIRSKITLNSSNRSAKTFRKRNRTHTNNDSDNGYKCLFQLLELTINGTHIVNKLNHRNYNYTHNYR